jgi:hypothetical protein
VVGGEQDDADVSEPSGDEQERLLGQQLLWWQSCLAWVRERLQQRDEVMKRDYARRLGVDSLQVQLVLTAGDWVLMKQKRPGKMLSKALGPYKILRYKNENGLVAELETVAGKKLESSVANLLPLRPGVRPIQRWRAKVKDPHYEQLFNSDSDYFSSSGSEQGSESE